MILLAHFVSGCQDGNILIINIIVDVVPLQSHFYCRHHYGYLAYLALRDEKVASRVAPLAAPG